MTNLHSFYSLSVGRFTNRRPRIRKERFLRSTGSGFRSCHSSGLVLFITQALRDTVLLPEKWE